METAKGRARALELKLSLIEVSSSKKFFFLIRRGDFAAMQRGNVENCNQIIEIEFSVL
jgi:hypothetical protein